MIKNTKAHSGFGRVWLGLIASQVGASHTDNLTQIIILDLRIKINIKHWFLSELLVRVLSILYYYMRYKQRFARKNSDKNRIALNIVIKRHYVKQNKVTLLLKLFYSTNDKEIFFSDMISIFGALSTSYRTWIINKNFIHRLWKGLERGTTSQLSGSKSYSIYTIRYISIGGYIWREKTRKTQ